MSIEHEYVSDVYVCVRAFERGRVRTCERNRHCNDFSDLSDLSDLSVLSVLSKTITVNVGT